MKLTDYQFKYFEYPFVNPIKIGQKQIKKRCGYYLIITTDLGESISELAPLAGLQNESLEICKKNIQTYLENNPYLNLSLNKTLSPQERFTLETAIIKILKNHPLHTFISKDIPNSNALIYLDQDIRPVNLSQTLKVKIGRNDPHFENNKLLELANNFNGKIRLDANRSLSVKQLTIILENINPDRIDYIEEPFNNLSDWNDFYCKNKIPLALDESYLKQPQKIPHGTKAIIIKPPLYGFIKSYELIAKLNKQNLKVVISSTFNSPQGISDLALLAHFQNSLTPIECGLDTLKYLDLRKTNA